MDEMAQQTNDLPAGWVWTTLEDIVNILDSQRIPINATERDVLTKGKRQEDLVPYYGATGQVGWIDRPIFDEELVLLGEDGAPFLDATKDKAYQVRGKSWVNNHAHVLRARQSLTSNGWICHYLNSFDFHEYVTGTTRLKLNQGRMKQIPVPHAPLPEQHRIVAEIETQFTRLDAGVAALKRAQAKLRRYKAAVLKAACEGRLVPSEAALARAEGCEFETGAALLARILAERRVRWEQANPGKRYVEPKGVDGDGLADLPEGWVWARVGQLFDVTIGGTPARAKAEYWNGPIPWVSSGEVQFNRIRETREGITAEGLSCSNAKLHLPGTVLLAMIGEGKTRGQAALLDVSATTNQNVASILCSEGPMVPEWVFYWLNARYEETRKSGSGGMQYALNSERIRGFTMPVPPLTEQHRIVAEVERRLSVAQEVESTVTAGLKRAERLRQSILKQAFTGRLTSRDVVGA